MTLLTALVLIIVFTIPFTQQVQAQVQMDPGTTGNDNCIKCHEDLYFLHDTGNWFCIREDHMTCTDCHGGNAKTLNQDEAHTSRAAHPIINEDVSKCQECHPEECYERVNLFDQEAGVSDVLVAIPITPDRHVEEPVLQPVQVPEEQESSAWINLWELLSIALVAGSALVIYMIYRLRHRMK
jgi:hypothetical protein